MVSGGYWKYHLVSYRDISPELIHFKLANSLDAEIISVSEVGY